MGAEDGKKPDRFSFEWVHRWRESSDLKPSVRLVLAMLQQYMNIGTGKCCPSYKTLARDTGLSPRQVMRLMKEAEDAGWIVICKGGGQRGPSGWTNLYKAVIPERGDTHDTP